MLKKPLKLYVYHEAEIQWYPAGRTIDQIKPYFCNDCDCPHNVEAMLYILRWKRKYFL